MNPYQQIKQKLQSANQVLILTGAGISAESGIPTYRGNSDSLWNNYKPEDLATPGAFLADPWKVLEWYNYKRNLFSKCKPNDAHHALTQLHEKLDASVSIITQNIDNLHIESGFPRNNIVEIHGNMWEQKCIECGIIFTKDLA